jgi:alkylation response protein AidB-like acyl-CoA dehydrogenase
MNEHSTECEHELAERFRSLGQSGLFTRLSEPATLLQGCRELAALAYDEPNLGIFLSVIAAAGLALPILRAAGHVELLEAATSGRAVLAVAVTEKSAGSDALAMRTMLKRATDGTLRLEGSKWHITNAPVADAIVVFAIDATTDDRCLSAVLVRPTDPGVIRGPALDLIGCRGSPTGEVSFDQVIVAADRILGRREDGKQHLELAFVRERVLAPWPLLGKMQKVLDDCLDHVERRVQFGKAIHEFQYVQEKIVTSFEAMINARHLAERAVLSVVAGRPSAALASLAKASAADAAAHVFKSAIEVFGSYGVQAERRYGDYLHDALCAQIAGGTRETHRKVVFGELRLERARARKGAKSPLIGGQP